MHSLPPQGTVACVPPVLLDATLALEATLVVEPTLALEATLEVAELALPVPVDADVLDTPVDDVAVLTEDWDGPLVLVVEMCAAPPLPDAEPKSASASAT